MLLAPLVALATAQFAYSPDPRRSFAAGAKEALLMLAPEYVCGSEASRLEWTGDGSALAVVRHTADLSPGDLLTMNMNARPSPELLARIKPRTELVVWSVAGRKARTLLSTDAARQTINEVTPLPASDRLIVEVFSQTNEPGSEKTTTTQSLAIVSAAGGTLVTLASVDLSQSLGMALSPTRAVGYVFTSKGPGRSMGLTARFFGASGRLSPPLTLSNGASIMFGSDGLPGVFSDATRVNGKPSATWRKIDPATAALGQPVPYVFGKDEAKPPAAPLDVRVATGSVEGANAPSLFLQLADGKPEEAGVVSTDGERGTVSPKGDAIAYVSQGSVMVRRLARVPRKAFEEARLAALRSVALSNAKQAGLALILYASDMDDVYPPQSDYDKIEPYLKNRSIMDSFTYTFGGGRMNEIEQPAETQIGYVLGPGGRAVVYADGHAKWIPDAP